MALLGFLGGVDEPELPPPLSEVMMVEMIKPSDVNIAVTVRPCWISLSFS